VTLNRSKGLLGTLDTIHSGSASETPINVYLTFEVKDLEYKVRCLRNKKIQSWESQRRKDPSK
jgi:hypothetical protein